MNNYLMLLVFTCFSTVSFSQSKNFIDQPFIETISKVDTLVVPDKITLSIDINEKDLVRIGTLDEVETMIVKRLSNLGIDVEKQFFVSDYATNISRLLLFSREVVKSKSYELVVYDAKTIGEVITTLNEIKVNEVEIIKTEFSNSDALFLSLKKKAIIKAKQQSDIILSSVNQETGKVLLIIDNQEILSLNATSAGLIVRKKYLKEEIAIPLEFQPIRLETTLTVKFAIK